MNKLLLLVVIIPFVLTACLFDDSSSSMDSLVDDISDVCKESLHRVDYSISEGRADSIAKGTFRYISSEKLNVESHGVAQLDVIYRDFPPSHPDFEIAQPLADTATKGLVQSHLKFAPPMNGEYDMYDGTFIARNGKDSSITDFDSWFLDTEKSLRINTTMDMPWENGGYVFRSEEFYPLENMTYCNPNVQTNNSECKVYGKQSLGIDCFSNKKKEDTKEICELWKKYGGPQEPVAAELAVNDLPSYSKYLHNGNYTMMSYAKIPYKAGYDMRISYTCGSDCWIYVDGVLAADVGGLHKPISGTIELEKLAEKNFGCHEGEPLSGYRNCVKGASTWQPQTWHHIQIFYVNRQTWNASFYLYLPLDDFPPVRETPKIVEATKIISALDTSLYLILDKELDANTIKQMEAFKTVMFNNYRDSKDYVLFNVYREGKLYDYGVEKIEKVGKYDAGWLYKIQGGVVYTRRVKDDKVKHLDRNSSMDDYYSDGVAMVVDSLVGVEKEYDLYAVGYWQYGLDKIPQNGDKIGFVGVDGLNSFVEIKMLECH